MKFQEVCDTLRAGHGVEVRTTALTYIRASYEQKKELVKCYTSTYGAGANITVFMATLLEEEERSAKRAMVLSKYEAHSPRYNLLSEVKLNEDFMSLVENLKGGRGKIETQLRELVDDGMITIKNEGFSIKLALTPLALSVLG